MIAFIEGKVLRADENAVIIKTAGGVGYSLFCSSATLSRLGGGKLGDGNLGDAGEVFLLVEMHMREDGIKLYGFLETEEQTAFRQLITVQGVSGVLAMAILSTFTPSQLATHIVSEDAAQLETVSGIGNKMAKRIVGELAAAASKGKFGMGEATPRDQNHQDALAALVKLGYGRSEAMGALHKAKGKTVEELIQNALSHK